MEGDVYIHGDTIGGGSLARAISAHMKKGYRVVMEEAAAYSIRNDLDEVGSMGIRSGASPNPEHSRSLRSERSISLLLKDFLPHFGEDLAVDVIAIAVQDHGVSPKGVSDRVFRFEKAEAMLRKDNRPESFHFTEDTIPDYYLRMRSAVKAVRRTFPGPVLVMDTAFSAILGCLDEVTGPSLVANAGNGHTIAALLIDGRIEGLYEHHTHELTPKGWRVISDRFARGELSSKEVYEANGHGAVTLKPYPGKVPVVVTGPNRDLFRGTSMEFVFAAPGGNTMMTGPMGLIKAARFRFGGNHSPQRR